MTTQDQPNMAGLRLSQEAWEAFIANDCHTLLRIARDACLALDRTSLERDAALMRVQRAQDLMDEWRSLYFDMKNVTAIWTPSCENRTPTTGTLTKKEKPRTTGEKKMI